MAAPPTPEHTEVAAQYEALRTIVGGDDWHSSIGSKTYLHRPADTDPQDCVYWAGVEWTVVDHEQTTLITTWTAIVRDAEVSAERRALKVLADMRHALTAECNTRREASAVLEPRALGSNYVTVSYSVETSIFMREG